VTGDEEVTALIKDILASPVLKRVFCETPNFTFNGNCVNQARLDRAELGDFDALVLGLFLMAHFKGQLMVPDLGFYGRDAHVSLFREDRLIAGVNYLDEIPPRLRKQALLVKDKVASGTVYQDAETLALYARHWPGTDGFTGYVQETIR
jgi:hypothetical protein